MNIERIRELNPSFKIYTSSDAEFSEYGIVISGMDTARIIREAEKIPKPECGSEYLASVGALEALDIAGEIKERFFGTLDTQIGYCHGASERLNALEWHSSSEVNIAVTDLVLFLAKRSELKDGKIDSSRVKAFYIKKGELLEVFATTLHFCPCQLAAEGFGCIVALPRGTNTPLEYKSTDRRLFRKNKWIVAHNDNSALISKGVVPGISGENFKIVY